jgi:hypothetical protein
MTVKPKSATPTSSVQDWLVRVLCAVAAAWFAVNTDSSLMANYGTSRFWETWVSPDSALAVWLPLVAFALLTGVLAGLVIGWIFQPHVALKVAAIAAALQFAAAALSGAVATGIVLAIGSLLGALPSRTR